MTGCNQAADDGQPLRYLLQAELLQLNTDDLLSLLSQLPARQAFLISAGHCRH